MKRRNGWLYALAASFLLHGGVLVSAWHGSWLSFHSQPRPVEQSNETILIPVEIHQFYAEEKRDPTQPSLPFNQTDPFASGWMKKISAVPAPTDEVTYASYIRDLILRQLVYPDPKKGKGIEVAVHVVFSLNSRGCLQHLEIPPDLRSTQESFNQAALEAVRRAAAQFPPFPPTVTKKEQRFSFLLLFRPNIK